MQNPVMQAPAGFVTCHYQAGERLSAERVYARIIERDHTVWRNDPTEIANRLGWLDSPTIMRDKVEEIRTLIDAVRNDGYTHALLLGMGGSSLAPEVFREVFGVAEGYLDLAVLDSTHPDAILAKAHALDPAKTLFLPATKSGGTVETLSFLKYFYNKTAAIFSRETTGQHFAAITDPGSGLEDMADHLGFRHAFRNDPNIGGRYSALSFYGLVAAGAIGMDLDRLLDNAQSALDRPDPGIQLGAFLGAGIELGRDKLTLLVSPSLAAAGAWIEQLVAESTGKNDQGILPVDLEPPINAEHYGADRLFVYLRIDDTLDARVAAIAAAGHPVLRLDLEDPYDLGATFFHWEIATAIAGYFLAIHPFDQPDVEAAKVLARDMVEDYLQQGQLPVQTPDLVIGGLSLYGSGSATSLPEALVDFLSASDHAYIALQAYIPATPANTQALQELRQQLLERTHLATTLGFGPRFLHSTGQLHKGDGGKGLFLQLTADAKEDAPIPDAAGSDTTGMSFGVLAQAQARGDLQALIDRGRTTLRVHLGAQPELGIAQLCQALT
jgi:glucose-6-phosphate isomerase